MAPSASYSGALLVRTPPLPAPASLPKQGLGRAGASLALRAAKGSDDFRALVSDKPAEPVRAKRDGWKGFGREVSNAEEEVQMQGEPASWSILNQIGVEFDVVLYMLILLIVKTAANASTTKAYTLQLQVLDSDSSYTALVYGTSALVTIWLSSIVISALDSIPVVPQVMEVVGLGFTVWFTSRYLIFKENRDELITRIGSIKKQVLGSRDD